jgi:hypothetical protein
MRLAIAIAIAAGSLCACAAASAQVIYPNANPPVTPPSVFPTAPYGEPNEKQPLAPQSAFAAAPYGARYYPGIGFRYAIPPSERIYGYYAGPRVYGYRVRHRSCEGGGFWCFDRHTRCGYGW